MGLVGRGSWAVQGGAIEATIELDLDLDLQ